MFGNQGIGIDSWNEVIEKANKDFHENRKELFGHLLAGSLKGSRKGLLLLCGVIQVHV